MIKVAYDNGISFFDTGNVYNHGEPERLLSRCLKGFPRTFLLF
ncbi:aldo/keto reductase [bacterium]|nr:aldo/keto reductase [bacterium]